MSVATTRTPLETVIDALAARGKRPRGNDSGWTALCPAHDDNTPSLSIGTGTDGRALIHCHTGCPLDSILAALGLTDRDLFAGPTSNGNQRHILRTHDYVDEQGQLLYQTVRFEGSGNDRFRQRRPDGNGGWIWNLGDVRRVVYRLPETLAAIKQGQTILVAEGEHDVDALIRAGAAATTNPLGATNWKSEYTDQLKGATVVLVIDRDATGRKRGITLHSEFSAAGIDVAHVFEPVNGKDAAEVLGMGYNLDTGFKIVDLNGPTPGKDDEPSESDRAPTSWAPVDLTDALHGIDIESPKFWHRSDGMALIYRGRVHWFQGESESCKSWAAQIVVAAELQAEHDVLYIDLEDDERGVIARLRSLGATIDQIAAHLIYLRPDEALRSRNGQYTDAWIDFAAALEARSYSLCIIDGVTEAMTIEALNLLDNTDIAAWMRLLPKRIAAFGAAVICIDHVTKNGETQGRYAIGGQHKLAGVTGAAYRFTTLQPLARAESEPVEGAIAVTVMKDRPGYVRGRAPEGKIGTLTITADPDGGVRTSLDPPGQRDLVDMVYVTRILSYLTDYDGSSKNQIEVGVEGNTDKIRDTLRWLTATSRGWVRIEHKGRSHLHFLTDEGRSRLDPT